jgi:DNA-directed RNA polymerase subunit H (RpoH/RPB5)
MQRLFDIKITQLEMVQDRGYVLTEDEADLLLARDFNEFVMHVNRLVQEHQKSVRSALSRMYELRDAEGKLIKTMLVFYGNKNPSQKQISVEVVRQFVTLIQRYNFTEAVLIVDAPLSSTSNDELKAVVTTKYQVFQESDLTYNPTRHVDVPRHELLSPEETQAKLIEMKADKSKLLIIKADDPIVRYYGWKPGGLIRIHRDDRAISIIGSKSINYRVIV